MDYADEVLKKGLAKILAKIVGIMITIIEYLIELYDVLTNPNLRLSEKIARALIITSATLIIVVATMKLAPLLLPFAFPVGIILYLALLILITWIVDWLKNWLYEELELSFIPLYKFAAWLIKTKLSKIWAPNVYYFSYA